MSSTSATGKITTFYSYKGGTGRSMALANIACILSQGASRGKILMIDWDLEAPGLHRYFQNRIPIHPNQLNLFESQPGLIDLFYDLSNYFKKSKIDDDEIIDTVFDEIGIEKYWLQTNTESLYLMTSGKLNKAYESLVANFDWNILFDRYPSLFSKFAEHLSKKFAHVLIDSRTGHTDISGICTTLMPDRLVVVFTPNTQSVSGVLDISKRAIGYRKQSDDLRQLVVFPLVSRVEAAEPKLREEWRFGSYDKNIAGYQPQFQDLFKDIYGLSECDLTSYFDDVQIQHVPRYAYGEEIAVLSERTEDRLSLARSYENFVRRLTGQVRPWDSIKDRIILDADKESINRAEETQFTSRKGGRVEKTVFICYRRQNLPWALAIYQYLSSHGYDVFFDYLSIPSGEFEQIILENIKARAHFLVVLTPSALERCDEPSDWMRREIETAIDEKRNIVPIMVENFEFGSQDIAKAMSGKLRILSQYNGLRLVSEYFFEAMDKLRKNFLNVTISNITTSPINYSVIRILDGNPIFDGLSKGARQLVEQHFEPFSCSSGTVIFNQGDPAVFLYLVLRGSVTIRYKPYDGTRIDLTKISVGGAFGWSAVIGGPQYTSGAVAREELQTIRIRGTDLHTIVSENPSAGAELLNRLAKLVSNRWKDANRQVDLILKQISSESASNRNK